MKYDVLKQFETLPWALAAIALVALFTLFICCVILFFRKVVNLKSLKSHHDVAAVVFANLGVLYSVLLGFTVVNVQQRFDKINDNIQVEAGYLNDLFRDAETFSAEDKQKVRHALIAYGKSVIHDEWPHMVDGNATQLVNPFILDLWDVYYNITPQSDKEMQWYNLSINKLNLLMNVRLTRLLGSQESLRRELWFILLGGAIALATFLSFFGLDSLILHLLLASIIAGTTGFLLFLIYSLDTAFSGDVSLTPAAIESFLQSMQPILKK